MSLAFQSLLLLFVASLDLLLGAIVFLQDTKDRTSRSYAAFALAVSAWGFGVAAFFLSTNPELTELFARFLYFAGGAIPPTFLYFAYYFYVDRPPSARITLIIFLPTLFFAFLYFFTDLLVSGYEIGADGTRSFVYGSLHLLFDLHLWVFFIWAFVILARKFMAFSDQARLHVLFVTLGTYSVLAVAGITNVLLPSLYQDARFIATGPIATLLWIAITAYAVARHKLFNMRVVTTEVLVFAFVLFLATRVLFSADTQEIVTNIIFLTAVLVLGIVLIRNVIREVKIREQVEQLATQLGFANERLKELDQLKNEFLSIASHQLRAPITAIRGYASLILERDYGAVPENLAEPIERIAESSRNMANSIEDYLNVSRIEQGRMKYDKSAFDLADLAKKTAEELRPVAGRRGLELSFEAGEPVQVSADVGKVKQVISNLIDNAIKYTEKGSVRVEVRKEAGRPRFTVFDTGMGIAREEIGDLFEKFKRARGANKINTTGTGLGLYVAKQLVEGHGGKIWAESEGPGKGSRFIVELPA